MSKKNEWTIEQSYLTKVYDKLLVTQEKVIEDASGSEDDSRSFLKSLSEDLRMNNASASDSLDSLIEIEQKNQELAQINYKREWLERQKANIEKLLDGPYFAKLDIQYLDEEDLGVFYIGVVGFSDEEHYQYVYDWRSPIANLYYENNIGETSYEAPMGSIAVDLKNRRQLKVDKSKLIDFFDTTTAIEDPMLLQVLNEESTSKLQDITSTIQKEQNAIIRDTKSDVLIVEGVAGSGKTSTILQRIAFLLYRYRDGLMPDQVLLLSPNPMFSKYIEEVLPSLGEKNPRQLTYRHLMQSRWNHYEIETLEDQLANKKGRGTLVYMKAIESYVKELDVEDLALSPIMLENEEIISIRWMKERLVTLPKETALHRKLDYLKEQMLTYLINFIRAESRKQFWRDQLENLSNEEYTHLTAGIKKGTEDEVIQDAVYRLVNRRYSRLRKKIARFSWIDLEEHYILATGAQVENPMSLDQATEFTYLHHLMVSKQDNRRTKFVIVDEVQDYSETQLYFLTTIFGQSSFTLVGDGHQGIFKQGTNFERVEELFSDGRRKVTSVKLLKSYRSSGPISRFMKQLIGRHNDKIEVIDRPGKEPVISEFQKRQEYNDYVLSQSTSRRPEFRTVILTKSSEEATAFYKELGEPDSITLLTDSTTMTLNAKTLLMTVHLAKGLEFDVVFVHNVSEMRYISAHDLNLLYTASSRAMHELFLPYIGAPSKYLS